jgi:hypothetical protein
MQLQPIPNQPACNKQAGFSLQGLPACMQAVMSAQQALPLSCGQIKPVDINQPLPAMWINWHSAQNMRIQQVLLTWCNP